ncbi:hypothetical protein DesLBE_4916 [Desulfitobacterium sp. LBE]|uniref:Uncharacterized protein n=2 Tax=root TaxID=1 RepID=A0A098B2T2_DESHA|nr:hypothetical protein DesLBE_4916 [Desulfitobacterium sp. LBE]CDX02667.1 Hypothetical protein DPCES_2780 [Desulfitobacterium hafniense]
MTLFFSRLQFPLVMGLTSEPDDVLKTKRKSEGISGHQGGPKPGTEGLQQDGGAG